MAIDRSQSSEQRGTQTLSRQGQGRSLSRPFPFGAWGGDLFSMSPFALLRAMTDEMDRTFSGVAPSLRSEGGFNWIPAMEVREKDGNLIVIADLPGIDKNDVTVELADNVLTIEGERKNEYEEGQGKSHRSERTYGHFYRAIQLPEGAHADQAKAEFRNGVLEVKVPLDQSKSNKRQIPIQDVSSQRK